MGFRAVLFDLDGTLVDSLEDLGNSMNSVLERLGLPEHPLEAYRRFVGEGMEMLVRRALPDSARDEPTLGRALEDMREEYGRRHAEKTRPYPGIPELLDALASRNLRLAILSNKPDGPTRAIVAEMLGSWHFDAVVGARPGVPKKPDPTAALAISRDLGIAPEAFLYLGDTDTDMKTARAAGMHAVGVLWGFRGAEELRSAGALALVAAPPDFLKYLESLRKTTA